MFCKHLAESSKLPPALGTLEEHIDLFRIQGRVWCQATVMRQRQFDPLTHGYCRHSHADILPATTKVLPAPWATVELSDVSTKATTKLRNVHAGNTTWLAQNFVYEEVNAKTALTVRQKMIQRTVMKNC